jgi:hypothetical protein
MLALVFENMQKMAIFESLSEMQALAQEIEKQALVL